jgi:hypothetical protein
VQSSLLPRSSDSIYIKGIPRIVTDEVLLAVLNAEDTAVSVDLYKKGARGEAIARYPDVQGATRAIHRLHQSVLGGKTLSVRFELGFDASGKRIMDRTVHHTRLRRVIPVTSTDGMICLDAYSTPAHTYSHEAILVNQVEYPFPTGLYLSRLIFLMRKSEQNDPLVTILTDPSLGSRYSKEISEAMAMADCTERAMKAAFHCTSAEMPSVRVFVLGDGQKPLCAAAMCLQLPLSWEYFSIDPLMQPVDLGTYSTRISLHACLSQEFIIPDSNAHTLSIVIACHSHAPLLEFWTRLRGPKVAISMPCCSTYCDLKGVEPLLTFEDFEVYSPKRKIFVHVDKEPA